MSTGYSWEGIRQVRATLLGARHVPERLCGGGYVYLGRYIKCSTFTFYLLLALLEVIGVLAARRLRSQSCDQAVAGLTPSWDTINSPRSTQPSIPPGYVNRVPALLAGVKAGYWVASR